jgi:hypothetical protein
MAPLPPPDPDAEMIARLQGARGFQPRAWIRENRGLVLVFGAYVAVVAAIGIVTVGIGHSEPGPAILFGVFFAPILMLRIYVRWRRRN